MRTGLAFVLFAILLALGGTACDSASTVEEPATSASTSVPTVTTATTSTTASAEPASVRLGESVTTTAGEATVYGVRYPVEGSADAQGIASKGFEFAVADIEVCPSTAEGMDAGRFHLSDGDSRTYTYWNVQIGAMSPNLTDSLYPTAVGVCVRGYLTFEVPPGKQLIAVVYAGYDGSSTIWEVTP